MVRHRERHRHRAIPAADMLTGAHRPVQPGHGRTGNPAPGQPFGEFRYWNIDAFAQDSWKVRSNLTLEYGVRFGNWTNNEELNGLGGYFDPGAVRQHQGLVPRPRHVPACQRRLLRRRPGAPRPACSRTGRRSRCRASTSPGTSTARATTSLRGGYGLFYNRNMGNVEYDNSLRLPPNAYQVAIDFWAGGGYGNGVGLNYDTVERGDTRQPDREHRHQHADARSRSSSRRRTASASRMRGGFRSTRSPR